MYKIGREIMRNEAQARKLESELRCMNLDDAVILVRGAEVHYEFDDKTGSREEWIKRLAWSIYNGR